MKQALSSIFTEVKKVPTKVWVAAIILPGGLVAITTYVLTKALDKKESKDDKGRNSQG